MFRTLFAFLAMLAASASISGAAESPVYNLILEGGRVIDGTGAPWFRADVAVAGGKITQGITTEITGEGQSIGPLNERMIQEGETYWKRYGVRPTWTTLAGYFEVLERSRPAINLATFVGAGVHGKPLTAGLISTPPLHRGFAAAR